MDNPFDNRFRGPTGTNFVQAVALGDESFEAMENILQTFTWLKANLNDIERKFMTEIGRVNNEKDLQTSAITVTVGEYIIRRDPNGCLTFTKVTKTNETEETRPPSYTEVLGAMSKEPHHGIYESPLHHKLGMMSRGSPSHGGYRHSPSNGANRQSAALDATSTFHRRIASGIPTKLTRISKFSTKSNTDRYSGDISGMDFLSDGRLVFADKSNNKVKLFSSMYEMIDEACLKSSPFDLAETERGDLAVTIPKDGIVQIYTVRETLSLRQEIETGACHGVQAFNSKLYVCCDTSREGGCIKVFDINYDLLSITPPHKNIHGRMDMCPLTGHIYCNSMPMIGSEKVYCVAENGRIIWKIKNPSRMHSITGMASNGSGIFVTSNNFVYYCKGDEKWVQLTKTLQVGAIALNRDNTRLMACDEPCAQTDATTRYHEQESYCLLFQIEF